MSSETVAFAHESKQKKICGFFSNVETSKKTVSIHSVRWQPKWRHDSQHDDTQHKDTQHNDTQHKMTLSKMTLTLMTLSKITLSIRTLSIMTLSIMTLA